MMTKNAIRGYREPQWNNHKAGPQNSAESSCHPEQRITNHLEKFFSQVTESKLLW